MGEPERKLDSAVATGRGDDGTTGLLYGGERITKDDLRTEAYGTIDEAVAALGLARARLGLKEEYGVLSPALRPIRDLVLRFQRELFVVAAELATNPNAWDRLEDGRTRVSKAMVDGVEDVLRDLEARIEMPRREDILDAGRTKARYALPMCPALRCMRWPEALECAGFIASMLDKRDRCAS